MKFLSKMVMEISLTKNLERKKKGQTQGRTNRRMPICNPTTQLVLVELYTKYEVSILNGCGDIFDEKVLRNYGRTDGTTDGTTDRCKPVYPPLFQSGGIKKGNMVRSIGYPRTTRKCVCKTLCMPPTTCLTLKGKGLSKKIIQNFIM